MSQDHEISLEDFWPESVAEGDFEGFEDAPVSVVEGTLSLGRSRA